MDILGEYEPGTLEILQETYDKELEETGRDRLRKKRQQEDSMQRQKRIERSLDDMRAEVIRKKLEKEQQEKTKHVYEHELDVRRTVLKYLELDERFLFDREKILAASERKLSEIAALRRNLEKEEDVLQKDYQRLTQGRVLELPEEMETELINLGLHPVYGMEWLRRNGYTEKQNQELVRIHPFLPYALILSEQEVRRLSQSVSNIYTSFPVPIIIREHLEQKNTAESGGVITLPGISFYILFNENLLNEEKLRLLLQEKELKIQKKQEAIAVRQKEYQEYFERKETIRTQSVDRQLYDTNLELLEELTAGLVKLDADIRKVSQELSGVKEEIEHLAADIRKTEHAIEYQNRRKEDFTYLCAAYEAYGRCRAALDKCRKETIRLQEKQKLSQNETDRLAEKQRTLENEREILDQRGRKLNESLQMYQRYEKTEAPDSKTETDAEFHDMKIAEARYTAITANITKKGMKLFERNENAQEYFGTQITTKNLYDVAIGVGNIQIRLYKIEEQREYPITWAEVARNSGGEGFLSAFVILSSLLYYMRRDDTDIFADRNEGKVLLMDNPFAQTNAAHLLKPLMDMAEKTNTQLICLTGLGGESIYNRFDNIYVLNLIAASLRSGMQYLKADHLRGNEPETIVVSQIEVMEQQELVF